METTSIIVLIVILGLLVISGLVKYFIDCIENDYFYFLNARNSIQTENKEDIFLI